MLVMTDISVIDNVSAFVINENLTADKKLVYNVEAISNGIGKVTIASFIEKTRAIQLLHSISTEYAKGVKILDLRLYPNSSKEADTSKSESEASNNGKEKETE